ncbi:MAG: efflux RND transporter periplasmic adaptor subunit [Candidatus Woesebacteria bacterium]
MKNFITSLRTHWIRTGIILLVLVGGGYVLWRRSHPAVAAPTYQTGTVEKGTIIVAVTGSGQVSTANSVQVITQASGVVQKIYVKNGDQVKAGQKIADLELDQEGKQRYSSALSSYQSAKNNVDGAKASLYSLQSAMFNANQKFINGVVAENVAQGTPAYIQQDADWLAAEANYKRQVNVITQSQNALNASSIALQQSSATVYAPISGTLTGFSLQTGSVITAQTTTTGSSSSQKIASVTTVAIPTITINLTQIDVPKIKVGDKTTITLDAYADKTYTGKVVSIDTVGSVTSGVTAYPTVIALDQTNPDILSNMSAQANIITDSKTDVLIVPSTAVKTTNGTSTVQIMKNGKPESVTVEIGLVSDTDTEIKSGLSEGDTIVTAVIQSGAATRSTGTTSVFSSFGGARGGATSGGNAAIRRAN